MSRKKRTSAQRPEENRQFSLTQKWIVGLILTVTFLAFANSIWNGFAYDDTTQILQNESIRSYKYIPLILTKESWFWRIEQDKDPNKDVGPSTPYYRPLVMIYLMVGWSLFKETAAGYHMMNILLHLI